MLDRSTGVRFQSPAVPKSPPRSSNGRPSWFQTFARCCNSVDCCVARPYVHPGYERTATGINPQNDFRTARRRQSVFVRFGVHGNRVVDTDVVRFPVLGRDRRLLDEESVHEPARMSCRTIRRDFKTFVSRASLRPAPRTNVVIVKYCGSVRSKQLRTPYTTRAHPPL